MVISNISWYFLSYSEYFMIISNISWYFCLILNIHGGLDGDHWLLDKIPSLRQRNGQVATLWPAARWNTATNISPDPRYKPQRSPNQVFTALPNTKIPHFSAAADGILSRGFMCADTRKHQKTPEGGPEKTLANASSQIGKCIWTFLKISGWTKKRNPVCDGGGAGLPKIPSSRFWRQIPLDCGPINSSSDGKNLDPIRSGWDGLGQDGTIPAKQTHGLSGATHGKGRKTLWSGKV